MYTLKGFFRNGHSGANFDDEDIARHAFGRCLTRYTSSDMQLERLELWDDDALICLFERMGVIEQNKVTPTHFIMKPKRPFPWLSEHG